MHTVKNQSHSIMTTGETNGSRFELYALLGEAYGTGLPLGFILLLSNGGAAGGIQRYLTKFISHIQEKWRINTVVGLSDKNMSEINSCRVTISTRKHQLCFWHGVTAVKKRLSTLRRMPAFYDVEKACAEFSWIDKSFVPIAQHAGDQVGLSEVLLHLKYPIDTPTAPLYLCRIEDNPAAHHST